ncbi:hypothetical protein OAT16_09755 [Prolixibacteraceae bacterium]|nr:hypothetical protein [Prolixibacteraceae bacterium]
MKSCFHDSYLDEASFLEEVGEEMKVPFDITDDMVLLSPKDNEKNHLWCFLSEEGDHEIADYIVFKQIGSDMVCFIMELKCRKTSDNTKKATKQICSTYPLVRMMYEKTTGLDPEQLKVIGLRVFGPPNSGKVTNNGRKFPAKLEMRVDGTSLRLVIGHFEQNSKKQKLTCLDKYYREVIDLNLF